MKPEHRAASFFFPDQEILNITPLGSGNVNETWLVRLGSGTSFVLQKLSSHVFPDPALVMGNLERVIGHLQQALQSRVDLSIQVPRLFYSPDGKSSAIDPQGSHWRALSYINDARTLSMLETAAQAGEVGRLLGCFHQLLSSLDPATLHDPLPGFHATQGYLDDYDHLRRHHPPPGRVREQWCADRIEQFRKRTDILERHRAELRIGLIHGDPKVANFLFAHDTDTAISLIDLDTVMPGLVLHDLGDCLRSCCNPAGEEIDNPAEVSFKEEYFTAVMSGYWSQAPDLLGVSDTKLLVDAAWLISFELGLRFFTDHLRGNRYFKVRQPDQNLHRARVQLHLAESILNQRSRLDLLWQQIMMAPKNRTSSLSVS